MNKDVNNLIETNQKEKNEENLNENSPFTEFKIADLFTKNDEITAIQKEINSPCSSDNHDMSSNINNQAESIFSSGFKTALEFERDRINPNSSLKTTFNGSKPVKERVEVRNNQNLVHTNKIPSNDNSNDFKTALEFTKTNEIKTKVSNKHHQQKSKKKPESCTITHYFKGVSQKSLEKNSAESEPKISTRNVSDEDLSKVDQESQSKEICKIENVKSDKNKVTHVNGFKPKVPVKCNLSKKSELLFGKESPNHDKSAKRCHTSVTESDSSIKLSQDAKRRKLQSGNSSVKKQESIKLKTFDTLKPIVQKFYVSHYIPDHGKFKHIFKMIHMEILDKKIHGKSFKLSLQIFLNNYYSFYLF